MAASTTPRRAVVAGSGPGGAVAALLLARSGLAVTVLERVAAPAAVGGGLLLQANGIAVLQGLGLEVAGAHRVRSSTIRDGAGRVLLDVSTAGAGGLDHNLVVRRSALFGALHDLLAADARIDVRLGHAVEALTPGGVAVATPAGPIELAADLVVAADGARSALRPAISPEARLVEGPTYVRAVVPGGRADDDVAGEWWTALGLFGTAPLGDGSTYVFSSTAHPDLAAAVGSGDVAALARRWGAELPVAGELLGRVAGADELIVSRADEVHAPRWVTERAALLGDAAHAMVPNTGQGANSALLDAAVLALEVGAAPSIAAGLARYEARRRGPVTTVQADARRVARMAHLTSGPARRARDLALRVGARLPADRQARRLLQEDPVAVRDAVGALVAAAGRG